MTPYLVKNEPDKCCACLSCVSVCPKTAITIQKKENGFMLPSINTEDCINCGICNTVCQYGDLFLPKQERYNPYYVAVRNKVDEVHPAVFLSLYVKRF